MLCVNQSLRMARLRAATCLRMLGASSGQWQTSPALGAAAVYTPVTLAPAYGKFACYSVLAVVHLCRSGLLVSVERAVIERLTVTQECGQHKTGSCVTLPDNRICCDHRQSWCRP